MPKNFKVMVTVDVPAFYELFIEGVESEEQAQRQALIDARKLKPGYAWDVEFEGADLDTLCVTECREVE
jgi:hypothetical protein